MNEKTIYSKLPTSRLTQNQSYEVGYGKPPKQQQFKMGQSGNPKGRPKGSKNKQIGYTTLKDTILKEAYRPVTIHEGERKLTMPIVQASIRALGMNAAKGRHASQKLFLSLVGNTETEHESLKFQHLETALNYKLEWQNEIDIAVKNGEPEPDPIPHPQHIFIDINTGNVNFTGPIQKEEKEVWDKLASMKFHFLEELNYLEKDLEDEAQAEHLEIIKNEITYTKKLLDIVRQKIPDNAFLAPSTLEYCKENPWRGFSDKKDPHQIFALELAQSRVDTEHIAEHIEDQ